MKKILTITNVSKEYKNKNEVSAKALDGISMEINRGELIAVCGVSGSGKSTLLHLISGVIKPDSGDIIFVDEDGKVNSVKKMNSREAAFYRNRNIGYVLQDFGLIPYRTVKENIAIPLYIKNDSNKNITAKVNNIMEEIGITDLSKRPVSKLSGGQKQRVAIARALVNNPTIILADEPTGALDSNNKIEIIKLFRKLSSSGKTIIMVTHDTEVARMCDRVINIKDGKTYEYSVCS